MDNDWDGISNTEYTEAMCRERMRMRHPRHPSRHPKKGTPRCRDVPRFLGKQTLTMSSVIARWQSHFGAVIARQTLGLRFLDLIRSTR